MSKSKWKRNATENMVKIISASVKAFSREKKNVIGWTLSMKKERNWCCEVTMWRQLQMSIKCESAIRQIQQRRDMHTHTHTQTHTSHWSRSSTEVSVVLHNNLYYYNFAYKNWNHFVFIWINLNGILRFWNVGQRQPSNWMSDRLYADQE